MSVMRNEAKRRLRAWYAIAVILMTCSFTSNAFEVDGLVYETTSDTEVSLVGPANTDLNPILNIPSEIEYEGITYKVASIGKMLLRGTLS